MDRLSLKTAIATILVLMIAISLQVSLVKANDEQASIDAANSSINQAFKNVLIIEKDGGNVTQLMTRLNDAGQLLAEAENAYQNGNLSEVSSKAQSARLIANQVNSETLNLRYLSLIGTQDSFWLTLVFSVIGAVAFTTILSFVWRRFKRAYIKKLLEMKPEVIKDATQ